MRQDRQTKKHRREVKKKPERPRGVKVLYLYEIGKDGLTRLPEVWAMP